MKASIIGLVAAILMVSVSSAAFAQHSAGRVPANAVPSGDIPADTEGGAGPFDNQIRSWNSQSGAYFTIFDGNAPEVLPIIAPFPDPSFIGAGEFVNGLSYMVNGNNTMYVVDDLGVVQNTYGVTAPPGGQSYSGLALDPTSGDVYAASTNVMGSTLFTMDVTTGSAVPVGAITGQPGVIAISFDGAGNLFGYDIVTDQFFQINPATGATSNAVALPFDANFGQGMYYDPVSDTPVMLAFNNGNFTAQMWSVDTSNPASPVFFLEGTLGSSSPGGLNQLSWGGVGEGGAEPPEHARFLVSKDFNDNNTASVDVQLTCNTGIPLSQPATIEEGDPVNFVIGDFEQGTLNCEVTEVVPDGYTASYNDGTVSGTNCSWTGLTGGQYFCVITNSLQQVEVEVTKVWIDENPEFNSQNVAGADWSCNNVAFGTSSGFLDFEGNPDTRSFYVYPRWQGNTSCSITEVDLLESGIEVDDSDCQGLGVTPGNGNSCTIYNTRLYEGIPTLSQYGLALMALLMLGVGFVAFRRYS